MSGTAPYVYLEYGDSLAALGINSLLYLYDTTTMVILGDGGYDLFEPGCVTARPDEGDAIFPAHSYDINYPYCRIALSYNMSDTRGDPQVGQLIPQAPTIAIQLNLVGCDLSEPVSVAINTQPPQMGCVIDIFPGYAPTDFYVLVDAADAVLPLRMYFTVTNGAGRTKLFWIGVRAARNAPASGSVVPGRPV